MHLRVQAHELGEARAADVALEVAGGGLHARRAEGEQQRLHRVGVRVGVGVTVTVTITVTVAVRVRADLLLEQRERRAHSELRHGCQR